MALTDKKAFFMQTNNMPIAKETLKLIITKN